MVCPPALQASHVTENYELRGKKKSHILSTKKVLKQILGKELWKKSELQDVKSELWGKKADLWDKKL